MDGSDDVSRRGKGVKLRLCSVIMFLFYCFFTYTSLQGHTHSTATAIYRLYRDERAQQKKGRARRPPAADSAAATHLTCVVQVWSAADTRHMCGPSQRRLPYFGFMRPRMPKLYMTRPRVCSKQKLKTL